MGITKAEKLERQQKYLAALRKTGVTETARRAAGLKDSRAIRYWREDAEFKAAEEAARQVALTGEPSEGDEEEPKKPPAVRALLQNQERMKRRIETLEDSWAQLAAVAEAAVEVYPYQKPKYTVPKQARKTYEELAVFFISDSQVGQKVTTYDTGGIEEYGLDVFRRRIERYKESVYALVEDVIRRSVPMHNAVILLGGDIVENEAIYEGQQAHLDLLAYEQIVIAAHDLAALIQWLAGMFENVWIQTVPGNHGATRPTTLNLDQIVYEFMRRILEKQTNITWAISPCSLNAFELGPLRFKHQMDVEPRSYVLTHGDKIYSALGTPWYAAGRAHAQYGTVLSRPIETLFIAHHHRASFGPDQTYCINGSWPGANDYSLHRLRSACRPQQWFLSYQQQHGWVGMRPIYLADRNQLEAEAGQITSVLPDLLEQIDKAG